MKLKKLPNFYNDKYFELVEILNGCRYLYELHGLYSFINVMSVQLRIFLIGSKHETALIDTVCTNPMLDQIRRDCAEDPIGFFNCESGELNTFFDFDKPKLPLNEWLEQILIYTPNKDYTVKEIIKLYSDNFGGAHIADKIAWKNLGLSQLAPKYIHFISAYVIWKSGIDFNEWVNKLRASENRIESTGK